MLNKAIVRWGMIAVFIFMISNGFISTPPSEIVLCFAGALTVNNNIYFIFMLLGVIISNYAGTLILYSISIRKGKMWYDKMRGMQIFQKSQFLCKLIPTSNDLISFFNNQEWMVFACRFIPFIRSIISFPAGIAGMNFLKFTVYSIGGITIWAFVWLWAGKTLVLGMRHGKTYVICVLFALFLISGIIGNIVRKRINNKSNKADSSDEIKNG